MWAHVTTASVWMRLPTLLMALACWWLIGRGSSRGWAVGQGQPGGGWTAAGMFLAVWLPLNSGLRPEPIIALGILLTWCSVERGVATSRLLPVAVACIVGALTLFSGPTGIASIGALLVAVEPLHDPTGAPAVRPDAAAGADPGGRDGDDHRDVPRPDLRERRAGQRAQARGGRA